MNHRLQVLVRVDLEDRSAVIHVAGCFTSTNYRALVPVVGRAHALPGHPTVTVDISRAKHVDSNAAALLEAACQTLASPSPTAPTSWAGIVRIINSEQRDRTALLGGQTPPAAASSMSHAS